jgi:hypothetical protein
MSCEREKRRKAFYDLYSKTPIVCIVIVLLHVYDREIAPLCKYMDDFISLFIASFSMCVRESERLFRQAIKSCNHVSALVSLCKCLAHILKGISFSSLPN